MLIEQVAMLVQQLVGNVLEGFEFCLAINFGHLDCLLADFFIASAL